MARAMPDGQASGGSLTVRGASTPRLDVHVSPVGTGRTGFGNRCVAVLVLVVEPGSQPVIDAGRIAATLGLTRGESEVTAALAKGRSTREIAMATGRTEAAIHWHLKGIYRKLGISRQADLVRLVLSAAQPPHLRP